MELSNRLIWLSKPAEDWQSECLPLGNGNLGCMVYGGVEKERIQFNQDTLWVGSESNTGAYQNFGDLYIEMPHSGISGYRRELDISRAAQTITYEADGVRLKRAYFASYPANVLVFRFTADTEKSLSGRIRLVDAHGAPTVVEGHRLICSGDLEAYQSYRDDTWDDGIVLDYEAQVLVLNEGGALTGDNGTIVFTDCDALTLLLAAGTDYVNDRDRGWKGEHPHGRITATLNAAAGRPYPTLLEEHIQDYQALYNRLSINLGTTDGNILKRPTDERLAAYRSEHPAPNTGNTHEGDGASGMQDADLEELLFQYARYLMISCSRPGSLPSNLQGLWNESNEPPWRADYHSDVNTQMHYWFVDQANLSDCFSPLAEWFFSIREVRREETRSHFRKRGIAMHAENGIFGGSTWKWSVGDASWLANNLMDHYRYTLDRNYLETRAYPILKDLFTFWEDHLIEIASPDGRGTVLVAPDGFSPEHGPREDGVSFDQQLAWDLLSNFAEASEILKVDQKEREKAIRMRDRLLGPQIGNWGQLQEWMVDRDDRNDKHRHLSHLIAVHPGRQISPLTAPDLAEAAVVSMNARGDGATGWSKAWKINIWARLQDGNRAYKLLHEMIQANVYDNLFATHPPFQIDGNFGYASGVCEMLMQSHLGYIDLLPALPRAWPEGEICGIRARGGFSVDIAWREGSVTQAVILSDEGSDCILRAGMPVTVKQGTTTVKTEKIGDGVISFSTEKGKRYHIEPDAAQMETADQERNP